MQKAIANVQALSESLLRDRTNKAKPAQAQEDSSDYFLLTEVIGTEWLISCVGLFFLIGKDRLLFTHIFVGWEGGMPKSALDRELRKEVSSAILKRLEYISGKQAWTSKDVIVDSLLIANGLNADLISPVRDAVARFIGRKDPATLNENVKG